MLQKGTKAPDFTLKSTFNGKITLESFKGKKNVILVFYPGDNTPVCTGQLSLYNELTSLFESYDAQILGVNNDSLESHIKFSSDLKLDFPLLADEQNNILEKYEVFDKKTKESLRAIYIIDKDGKIHWSHLSPNNINPGADGILGALDQLK